MRDYDSEGPAKGRKEYLVLFEEPELFLHPHLMRQLRDLVYSVSVGSSPFQVLCASHSPQMIDLSRTKSSLVRMVRTEEGTKLFQLSDPDLIAAQNTDSKLDLKERMYEVLRFNPYICESFYADEVVLIEGPTEELMLRGILQTEKAKKDIFIVNCGSITNVPFYQRIYEKFSIRYHVICDTDDVPEVRKGKNLNPIYDSGIQKTVSTLCEESESAGLLRTFTPTFEPAHRDSSVPIKLRLPEYPISDGKPYNANLYWKEILATQYGASAEIERVPIIRYVKEILAHTWL
jgi:predicted ATP-dependent endonuclease of OLD family